MTIDAVGRFALGWLALVGWSLVTFSLLERLHPRHREHPGARRVVLAAALLAVDTALAQALFSAADLNGGRIALAWLVSEVLRYALHRAMHRVPLLWRFHRMHHDGAPLAWTTTWYIHPVDAALHAIVAIAAAALVGGGAAAAAWFVVGRRVWAIVLHANIAWPASRLDNIIATPPFHARHHREDLAPANFAGTLPVLDRLFGSYASARATAVSLPCRHSERSMPSSSGPNVDASSADTTNPPPCWAR
jgi:sterol desaturase/sphingolipid hydroxylase (fatty acid hydroxylase superfamily)